MICSSFLIFGEPFAPGWLTPALPLVLTAATAFAPGPERTEFVNAVVLLTDGRNDDGVSGDDLLEACLRAELTAPGTGSPVFDRLWEARRRAGRWARRRFDWAVPTGSATPFGPTAPTTGAARTSDRSGPTRHGSPRTASVD